MPRYASEGFPILFLILAEIPSVQMILGRKERRVSFVGLINVMRICLVSFKFDLTLRV